MPLRPSRLLVLGNKLTRLSRTTIMLLTLHRLRYIAFTHYQVLFGEPVLDLVPAEVFWFMFKI